MPRGIERLTAQTAWWTAPCHQFLGGADEGSGLIDGQVDPQG